MAFIVGPLYFYKLVFIGTMFTGLYSLLETSMPPNVTMKSEGFEYILSWEPGNNFGITYYHVKYKPLGINCLMHRSLKPIYLKSPERHQVRKDPPNKRRSLNLKVAEECFNITHLFCNLTKELTEFCQQYFILVEQLTENGTQKSALYFNPYLNTCLPLPWFEITACPNCINVTVNISSPFLEIYNDLQYEVKLIKPGFTETRIVNSTRKANFHRVVTNLNSNTNYCISVDVSSSVTNQCAPSALKCIVTRSKDKSGLVASSVIGGIFMIVGIMLLLYFLLRAGFVCLRENWPNVLNISFKFSNLLIPLNPEAQRIQIIPKGKRKETEYDYEDDCESDRENDGGYTHRGPLHKISKSCSSADSTKQLSIDSSSVASDCLLIGAVNCELEPEGENLPCRTNEEESKINQTFCSTSELNPTSLPEPEISVCLNINLKTVTVGIPDRNWDAETTLSSYEEEAVVLPESFVSKASEHVTKRKDMQHSNVHNLSYTQQNTTGSGESESSDSETDCIGEYMRR